MWKSGEPPSWNPDVGRFENIGFDETGTPGSGFWPFWLKKDSPPGSGHFNAEVNL